MCVQVRGQLATLAERGRQQQAALAGAVLAAAGHNSAPLLSQQPPVPSDVGQLAGELTAVQSARNYAHALQVRRASQSSCGPPLVLGLSVFGGQLCRIMLNDIMIVSRGQLCVPSFLFRL